MNRFARFSRTTWRIVQGNCLRHSTTMQTDESKFSAADPYETSYTTHWFVLVSGPTADTIALRVCIIDRCAGSSALYPMWNWCQHENTLLDKHTVWNITLVARLNINLLKDLVHILFYCNLLRSDNIEIVPRIGDTIQYGDANITPPCCYRSAPLHPKTCPGR